YLHGSDPKSDAPVGRIAKLSEQIARELDLPSKQVDDIRVAALLHDLDNVEITTQLISRAVTALDSSVRRRRTFLGTDLGPPLGEVLHGSVPTLVNQHDGVYQALSSDGRPHETPLGVHIIRAARLFDRWSHEPGAHPMQTGEVVGRLRSDPGGIYSHVIDA